MAAGGAGIAIRHVNRALFVRDGDEVDAGGRKNIERVHEGGADDAEHMRDAVDGEGFDQGLRGAHLLRRLTHEIHSFPNLVYRDDKSDRLKFWLPKRTRAPKPSQQNAKTDQPEYQRRALIRDEGHRQNDAEHAGDRQIGQVRIRPHADAEPRRILPFQIVRAARSCEMAMNT